MSNPYGGKNPYFEIDNPEVQEAYGKHGKPTHVTKKGKGEVEAGAYDRKPFEVKRKDFSKLSQYAKQRYHVKMEKGKHKATIGGEKLIKKVLDKFKKK